LTKIYVMSTKIFVNVISDEFFRNVPARPFGEVSRCRVLA